jgi:hypothetical protein
MSVPTCVRHTPQIKQELTIFVSHGFLTCPPWATGTQKTFHRTRWPGNTPDKSAQDRAAHLAELNLLFAMPEVVRTPPRTPRAPCHGASGRGGCRERSKIAGTRRSLRPRSLSRDRDTGRAVATCRFTETYRQHLLAADSDVTALGKLYCRDSSIGQKVRLARLGTD